MLVPRGRVGYQEGESGPCSQRAQLSKGENQIQYTTKHSERGIQRAVAAQERGHLSHFKSEERPQSTESTKGSER